MGVPISIVIDGKLRLSAELNDSATAAKIAAALPIELSLSRWGDEYYGSVGVNTALEKDARTLMAIGEIAYWPPGSALCLFFGPTPASSGSEPRAASPVNPLGRFLSDCDILKTLGGSVRARIEKAAPKGRPSTGLF